MDESKWNSRVADAGGDFMQSVEWGAFQRALGRDVFRVDAGGILSQGYIRAIGYGQEQIYIPMGPLPYKADHSGKDHLAAIAAKKKSGTVFIECDLIKNVESFTPTTTKTRQPKSVTIVDIEGKSKDVLNSRFHATLKENISRAERYELSVREEESWEGFFELYLQTMERHNLRPWTREYMSRLWETLRPYKMIEIWSCFDGADLLATNLYILFNGRSTHLFGGTSSQKRETMAPHFLHYQMMNMYSQRGFLEYDLGKIDPVGLKNLTSFKERFGGKRKEYPGNFRYILKPLWYRMYSLAKR